MRLQNSAFNQEINAEGGENNGSEHKIGILYLGLYIFEGVVSGWRLTISNFFIYGPHYWDSKSSGSGLKNSDPDPTGYVFDVEQNKKNVYGILLPNLNISFDT